MGSGMPSIEPMLMSNPAVCQLIVPSTASDNVACAVLKPMACSSPVAMLRIEATSVPTFDCATHATPAGGSSTVKSTSSGAKLNSNDVDLMIGRLKSTSGRFTSAITSPGVQLPTCS